MRKLLFFVLITFLTIGSIYAQTRSITNVKRPAKTINIKQNKNILKLISKEAAEKFAKEKAYAIKMAKEKDWPLIIEKDGVYKELIKVSEEGTPIYFTTYNINASKSTRANTLNTGGLLNLNLDGQGMTAHIWDAGLARTTHQEYDGAGGNNRFSIGDGTTTLHFHSAHVTGTIIASGFDSDAKGMAPQAHAIGYDWNNDQSEAATAANNGMLVSNHSYGYDAASIPDDWFGQYSNGAVEWDDIMYNAPYYLMMIAAGNDGDDNSSNGDPLDGNSSYDKLSGKAVSKNSLVVANAQDANIDANGDLVSVSINSSSSEGPTDDYRIKPDITGNGTNVYSTYESADDDYASITGTSMATPNVTGTLLLLQQHYNNVKGSFMKAATLKGLALHTADDAGTAGPDAIFGWGLLNAKRAAEAITDEGTGSVILETSLANSASYSIDVFALGGEDLIASICWTDPAGNEITNANNNTPVLVNDLDIRVTESTNTYYPYKLTGITTNTQADNTVDPYERVNVTNPTAGTLYTITITHKGALSSPQDYSLIITGITGNNAKPNANFEVNTPSTLLNPLPILEGDIVTYTNLTTGVVDSYSWVFDGGTPSTSANLDPGNITYNTTGLYDVTLTAHNNANGDSTLTKTDRINVLDPTIETCNIVNQFYGTPTLYGTGDGYFTGTNQYHLTKFSEKFENYEPYNKLTGTRIYWGEINNGSSPDVTIVVWRDNGSGLPGTILESKDIPLTTILTDFNTDGYSDVVFDNEVILPNGAFYVGLIAPNDGSSGDTLAIISNNDADGPDNTAYTEYNGSWAAYSDISSNTIMLAIQPTLCFIPNPPPAADFVADQTNIIAGTTVNFTDLTVNNPTDWSWDFGDGNTSSQQNPSNTYTSDGLYTVTLTVMNADGDSDTETKTSYIVVDSQTYCTSNGNMDYGTAVTLVNFESINNSTGKSNPYENYTSIVANVTRGNDYNLIVNTNTDGEYTIQGMAWIDWNDDGDFDDSGEEFVLGNAQNVSNGPFSNSPLSISIPTNASIGQTRMRISAKYNAAATACETGFDGEVEDYSIIISAPTPAPVADFTGTPLTICEGSSVTFTDGSTNTPTSWSWNFGDGSNIDHSQNPTHTYANAGTYTVVLTATNTGGSDDEIKTNYVTVIAEANAGSNGTLTICEGTDPSETQLFNQLGDSPDAGGTWTNSGNIYTYTVTATSPCTNDATATVTVTEQAAPNAGTNGTLTICEGTNPSETQLFNQLGDSPDAGGTWSNSGNVYTYTVTATSPCTNDATATVTVTEQAAPNAGTNGALTICEGTTPSDAELFAQLSGSPDTGGSWTNSGNIYTYTVTATSPCTNDATATITVTEDPLPTAASSANASETTICNGESTDLTYQGGSGDTFNWYTSSCGSSLVGSGNNLSINPTTTTTYYGRWENTCGNSSCQSVTITVNNMPNLIMSSSNASCGNTNGSATVEANGGTGSYTYLWDDASAQETATASNLGQGVYNVTVTSGACSATDNITVNEDGAPTVEVSASETTICNGETTILTATGADTYSWSPNTDLDATTGTIVNATPSTDIMYTVTGTTAGCSASASVNITVNHTPTVDFTIDASGEPVINFTNTTTGADSYSWDLGDGTTEITTDVSHEYLSNNNYTVILSATNECGTETSQQTVTITNIGITSLDKSSIKVYPNPAETTIYINLPIENVNIELVNMEGKMLKSIDSKNSKNIELNVEDIATGIYHLVITTENNEQVIVKVVKK